MSTKNYKAARAGKTRIAVPVSAELFECLSECAAVAGLEIEDIVELAVRNALVSSGSKAGEAGAIRALYQKLVSLPEPLRARLAALTQIALDLPAGDPRMATVCALQRSLATYVTMDARVVSSLAQELQRRDCLSAHPASARRAETVHSNGV
jgi:hypothetical protein